VAAALRASARDVARACATVAGACPARLRFASAGTSCGRFGPKGPLRYTPDSCDEQWRVCDPELRAVPPRSAGLTRAICDVAGDVHTEREVCPPANSF
jgi:hypothetical protein